MTAEQCVVVIGGGAAGFGAVTTLRDQGFDGKIHLIGDEAYLPYDRPAVSKDVLHGDWDIDRILLKPHDWYETNQIELHLGQRASAIDPIAQTVQLANGEVLKYSDVLVATGGRPKLPALTGLHLDGVFTVRNFNDAMKIKAEVPHSSSAVVVGAGFIGAEGAASLRQLGLDVTMLEFSSAPMERALGAEVGGAIAEIHRSEGVNVVCNEVVDRIHGFTGAEAVSTVSGKSFPADIVIVGVGITPRLNLLRAAGCELANGVIVDEHARTTVPHIYAAGDIAAFPSSEGRLRLEHYDHAVTQGGVAARSMLGDENVEEEVPWVWSDQFGISFQYCGHTDSWDEIIWRRQSEREFAAFYITSGRLKAAFVSNMPRVMRGARMCLKAGVLPTTAQLQDPDLDLRKLAKSA